MCPAGPSRSPSGGRPLPSRRDLNCRCVDVPRHSVLQSLHQRKPRFTISPRISARIANSRPGFFPRGRQAFAMATGRPLKGKSKTCPHRVTAATRKPMRPGGRSCCKIFHHGLQAWEISSSGESRHRLTSPRATAPSWRGSATSTGWAWRSRTGGAAGTRVADGHSAARPVTAGTQPAPAHRHGAGERAHGQTPAPAGAPHHSKIPPSA